MLVNKVHPLKLSPTKIVSSGPTREHVHPEILSRDVEDSVRKLIEKEIEYPEKIGNLLERLSIDHINPEKREAAFRKDRYLEGLQQAQSKGYFSALGHEFSEKFVEAYFKSSAGKVMRDILLS